MTIRRNNYDVSNSVDTTDDVSVRLEVSRIFLELFPRADLRLIDRAFMDVGRLYRGEHPSYRACDTAYHDIQHVLEVSLAMARLMDGYERSYGKRHSLGARIFTFGIVMALLHDVGYLRHVNDSRHSNGAEYTKVHVSRGAKFIERYLIEMNMADLAVAAGELIHFTGYERAVSQIKSPGIMFRMLGQMLGTADIIAQMADRCYLEKCRDRLFPEFVQGGLASRDESDIRSGILFSSVRDLIIKTPQFYRTATARLDEQLGETHKFAGKHFNGQNLYIEEMQKNVDYASYVADEQDLTLLRRALN